MRRIQSSRCSRDLRPPSSLPPPPPPPLVQLAPSPSFPPPPPPPRITNELRILSAAFISVDGFARLDADAPERRLAWLHTALRCIQTSAALASGVLRSCFCDDKGLCCLITWGALGTAGHDDPERACTAALRIRDEAARAPPPDSSALRSADVDAASPRLAPPQFAARRLGPVSIGVTTGRVFCGIVGDAQRCEYNGAKFKFIARGTPGPTVPYRLLGRREDRLAAIPSAVQGLRESMTKLQLRRSASHGAYLASRAAAAADPDTRGPVELDPVEALGQGPEPAGGAAAAAAAAAAARPAQLEEAAQEEGRLLEGRPEATEQLVRFLAGARAGPGGGVLVLEGDGGTGRSRACAEALRLAETWSASPLLTEFMTSVKNASAGTPQEQRIIYLAETCGVPVLVLEPEFGDTARPFHPLREALRAAITKSGSTVGSRSPDRDRSHAGSTAPRPLAAALRAASSQSLQAMGQQQGPAGAPAPAPLMDPRMRALARARTRSLQDIASADRSGGELDRSSVRPAEAAAAAAASASGFGRRDTGGSASASGSVSGSVSAGGVFAVGLLERLNAGGGGFGGPGRPGSADTVDPPRTPLSEPRRATVMHVGAGAAARESAVAAECAEFLSALGPALATPERCALLERLLGESLSSIPGRRRAELASARGSVDSLLTHDEIFSVMSEPLEEEGAGGDELSAGAFLVELVEALFARLRLLILVDDAHALDSATARVLLRASAAPGASLLLTLREVR
eukprot:tig00020816_g14148.t1